MKRITKVTLSKELSFKANGQLAVRTINVLKDFRNLSSGNTHYMNASGNGRNTKYSSGLNLDLLKNFCWFTKDNDAPRGGVMGEYITISSKEIKLLNKRLDYFLLEIEQNERKVASDRLSLKKENEKKAEIKEIYENLEGDIKKWVALPKNKRHPAPKFVYEMKQVEKISWTEFEEKYNVA